ncbi:MAG: M48 family metallopeptidase, partial [Burkholderiales bacterium]
MQVIRLALLALAFTLASCASVGEKGSAILKDLPGMSIFDSPGDKKTIVADLKTGSYQVSSLAVGEEKDLARQRGEGLGFVRLETLEKYLIDVRRKLSAKSGVTNVPGKVIVLANPAYAAYSTPDGNVYLAMGWVPYLESEDEVAAIIAHELSHVLLTHHSADMVTQTQKRGQALHELGVGAKMAMNKTTVVTEDDQQDLSTMQLLTGLVDKVAMPVWGRRQEREADLLAVDLMVRADYSPIAMTTMLEKFRAWEKETKESDEEFEKRAGEVAQKNVGQAVALAWNRLVEKVSASHPDTGQRIEDVAAYLDRHYGDAKMPNPKAAPWAAVKAKPDVKEITKN